MKPSALCRDDRCGKSRCVRRSLRNLFGETVRSDARNKEWKGLKYMHFYRSYELNDQCREIRWVVALPEEAEANLCACDLQRDLIWERERADLECNVTFLNHKQSSRNPDEIVELRSETKDTNRATTRL